MANRLKLLVENQLCILLKSKNRMNNQSITLGIIV